MLHPFRPSLRRRLILLVTLALLVGACGGSDGSEVAAVPTAEPSVDLLPAPTPTSGASTSDAAASDSGVDQPGTSATQDSDDPATGSTTAVPTPAPLSCLSQRQRVAQLLLPLLTQPEMFGAQAFAAAGELGGIGFLGQPDAQITADIEALQLASFVPVMVASDEEGGSVQRLGTLLGPIPSASATAQSKTPEDVRAQWLEYGSRVRALGITVIFGPVLDVGSAPGIESRSFSDDPAVVAAYGRAVAEGLLEAGVMPVFKHFPGHGRATADSHLELPLTPSLDELRSSDLVPYTELLADPQFQDDAAVMVGHLSVPGLTDGVPTSLSPDAVTGLLRTELGFRGLVFTDALGMRAVVDGYGVLEAVELAILAGADVAILPSLAELTPALDYLVARAEADPAFAATLDNRVERVLAAKGQSGICTGAQ